MEIAFGAVGTAMHHGGAMCACLGVQGSITMSGAVDQPSKSIGMILRVIFLTSVTKCQVAKETLDV